jgi:hypothetical protein
MTCGYKVVVVVVAVVDEYTSRTRIQGTMYIENLHGYKIYGWRECRTSKAFVNFIHPSLIPSRVASPASRDSPLPRLHALSDPQPAYALQLIDNSDGHPHILLSEPCIVQTTP